MTFEKLKTDSYCVGGRHRSSTINLYGDITSKGSKVLIGHCSFSNRKITVTVSDNTIQAKGLGDFFKILGKKDLINQKGGKKYTQKSQQSS